MSIFLLPTTEKNAIPSAVESRALSIAHQQFAADNIGGARQTLFSIFGPAAAEQHFAEIQQSLAPAAPKAPVVYQPRPHVPPSPLLRLVKFGLVVGLGVLVFNALTSR